MYNAITLTINNVSLGVFENSIIYLRVVCHTAKQFCQRWGRQ